MSSNKTLSKNNGLSTILKAIKIIFKTAPFLFFLNISFYVILAFIPLLNLLIMQEMVNNVLAFINNEITILNPLIWLSFQCIVSVIAWLIESLHNLVLFKMRFKINYVLQMSIFDKTTKLPLKVFDDSISYDKIERASNAPEYVLQTVNRILEILKNLITVTGYFYMLFTLHWLLPISILILMIIPLYINLKLGKKRYEQAYQQTPIQRKLNYISTLLTGKEAAKELRLSNSVNYLTEKWKKKFDMTTTDQFLLEKKSMKYNLIIFSVKDICNLVFIILLLMLFTKKSYTPGEYFAFSQGITFSLSILGSIVNELATLSEDMRYVNNYLNFLDMEEEQSILPKTDFYGIKKSIEVKNLSFSYTNSNKKVLDNISFEIKKGEKIAIVGDNGAGKSTLINCITGLYKSNEGHIYFDNEEISTLNIYSLRNQISAVFQDFVRYHLTFKENICMNNIDYIDDSEEFNNIVNKVNLDEFLLNLKEGENSMLGTAFSNGQELSGGQWQKVALGRALFKNTDFIILDEPTSALDPITESHILNDFINLTNDKTAIFITHRLGICKKMDNIIVLKDGKKIEEGTHESLLREMGYYSKMYESQKEWYSK
ncbi:ATP-binding cassette, subfamily B [Paenisporosarcina quisquiliarum]|nr:ATP-binding cassette, subfamily B [Paenisporosarcina quisquiliarum]